MEHVSRDAFGQRAALAVSHAMADKNEAETLNELREAAEAAGITPVRMEMLPTARETTHLTRLVRNRTVMVRVGQARSKDLCSL